MTFRSRRDKNMSFCINTNSCDEPSKYVLDTSAAYKYPHICKYICEYSGIILPHVCAPHLLRSCPLAVYIRKTLS